MGGTSHLKYFLYLRKMYCIWLILYVTVSLRAFLYPTFNNYHHPLIMMSQLKVMYHPWHNLLYQQHNVECHTIFDILEYCAGDCIFCLIYYKSLWFWKIIYQHMTDVLHMYHIVPLCSQVVSVKS